MPISLPRCWNWMQRRRRRFLLDAWDCRARELDATLPRPSFVRAPFSSCATSSGAACGEANYRRVTNSKLSIIALRHAAGCGESWRKFVFATHPPLSSPRGRHYERPSPPQLFSVPSGPTFATAYFGPVVVYLERQCKAAKSAHRQNSTTNM